MCSVKPGTKAETGAKKKCKEKKYLKTQNKREPRRTDLLIPGSLRKQQSPLLALC